MPFYGRTFWLSTEDNNGLGAWTQYGKAGTPGKYTNESGFLAYYEVILFNYSIARLNLLLNNFKVEQYFLVDMRRSPELD